MTAALGRTTITGRALQHLAVALACDAGALSPRDVRVALADEVGKVRASVTVQLWLGDGRTDSLIERGAELRRALIAGMRELAGREVATVDVRFSGIRAGTEKRVE